MMKTLNDLAQDKMIDEKASTLSSRTYQSKYVDDFEWLLNHTVKRKLYLYASGRLFKVSKKDLIAAFLDKEEERNVLAYLTFHSFMFQFID